MRRFKKLSIMFVSLLICVMSAVIFTGCDKNDKTCKLYVFATQGGQVLVDDNTEPVVFGDEGSKVFEYKKGGSVSLKAVAEPGYVFVKWVCTEKIDHLVDLTKEQINLNINDTEVVIRANFILDGTVKCSINWENGAGFEIVPLEGYELLEVDLRQDFKFKIVPGEGYDLSGVQVKANGESLTPNLNGVYTIVDISQDITLVVSGAVKKNYKILIDEEDYQRVVIRLQEGYTYNVAHGEDFKFAVEVQDDGFNVDNLRIYANDEQLTSIDGVYTISNITQDVTIIVEVLGGSGSEEDPDDGGDDPAQEQISTFTLNLKITEQMLEENGEIEFYMPDEIVFTLTKADNSQVYLSSNYPEVFSFDGNKYSATEFVSIINNILDDNFLDYELIGMALDGEGQQVIIEFAENTFTVYWDIFQSDSMNVYMIVR